MQTDTTPQIEIGGLELQKGAYIDNYRYERPIGKGGMADVLLGIDPSGREMAIKVLKASRFKVGKKRFSREFRTLAKMKHPNVIRVDSYGDIYGHPYIAMDYIKGTDLHKTIRQFPLLSLGDRWQRIREILTDISRALLHIHSLGIVHRDLKPSNILLNETGRCILTDFGIVKELNADVEVSTSLVGTWAYASPEQIGGQDLDHRSDLYSLGIILYAMLCGRRPFAANNMAGYLKLHQEQQPKPPSAFIPEIPTLFEEICLKLLEKSPQDRFQSASEILQLLGEDDHIPTQSKKSDQLPFFQEKTCSQMLQIIQQNLNQVSVLVAEEGFGKSRIFSEFEKRLEKLHLPHKRLRPPTKQAPYEMALQLAKYIATESGDISLHTTISIFSKTTQKIETNLRHRLFDESAMALRALLEERPQIFLIDDIDLCHESSYEFFLYLQKITMERYQLPLFLFLSSSKQNHHFPNVTTIQLKELQVEDVVDILKTLTPQQDDLQKIAEKVHQETDGIPLFLNAFIRQLIKERKLEKQGNQFVWLKSPIQIAEQNFDIPISIRQLVKQRVAPLSQDKRQALNLLSISGRPLPVEAFLEILDWTENKAFDILESLLKERFILSQKKGFDEHFDISRRKYSEVLYEDLPSDVRKQIHHKLAIYLKSAHPLPNLSILQQIGEHFRCAGIVNEAYSHLCLVGIKLWERGLLNAALHNIQLAQPLTKAAKQAMSQKDFELARYNLLFVRSAVAHNKGEWSEALKHLKTQWRYAKRLDDWNKVAQTQLDMGDVLTRLGQIEDGQKRITSVLLEARKKHSISYQVEAYHHLCALAWMTGDLEKGEELAQKGLSLLDDYSISLPKAKILLSMSAFKANQGKLALACEQMKEAAQILEQLTRKELLSIVYCNLAEVLIWRGLWEEAQNYAEQSSLLSEESLHKAGQTQSYLVLAFAELEMGFYSRANQYARRANLLAHTLLADDLIASSHYILAQVFLGLEDPSEAQKQLHDALLHAKSYDPEQYTAVLELLMSFCFAKLEQSQLSQKYFKSAQERLPSLSPVRQCECYYWMARYHLFHENFIALDKTVMKGLEISEQRAMWGWALKLKSLTLHSPIKNDEKSKDFHLLFDRLCLNMEEEQQILLLEHLQHGI